MKNEQGEAVGSVSKTLSSQESQLAVHQESYVAFEESVPSVRYATGGVIERGRAAMGSSASSSQPRTYVPLTVDWPQESGEWSLVTKDEEDDDGPREKP